MNVFLNPNIAKDYDAFYQTEVGKRINSVEKELVISTLDKLPKTKMLELGCGTGHWTQIFIEQGFSVDALDISDEMLKYALSKNLNANFIQADSEAIPFPDHSFSLISSITMLEFVNDQNKVFNEMYRVLKPGGYLLLGCLNAYSEIGINKESDPTFKDARFFSPSELKEKLKLFGNPQLSYGVYLSPHFEILDNTEKIEEVNPAFITAVVKKTN